MQQLRMIIIMSETKRPDVSFESYGVSKGAELSALLSKIFRVRFESKPHGFGYDVFTARVSPRQATNIQNHLDVFNQASIAVGGTPPLRFEQHPVGMRSWGDHATPGGKVDFRMIIAACGEEYFLPWLEKNAEAIHDQHYKDAHKRLTGWDRKDGASYCFSR
jgi:hypothetical protein